MSFDVKCPNCGCKFIRNEQSVEFYCSNCRKWRPVSDLVPIEKRAE